MAWVGWPFCVDDQTPPRRADRGDQPSANGALSAAASPVGPWGFGALSSNPLPTSLGGNGLRRGQEMASSMPSLLSMGLPAPPQAAGWTNGAGHDGRTPSASSESRSPSALRRARLRNMEERPNISSMQQEQEFGFDSAEPLHLWQSGSGEGEVLSAGAARPSVSPLSSLAFTPARRKDDVGSMESSSYRDGGSGSSTARRNNAMATALGSMVEPSGPEPHRSSDGSFGAATDTADAAFVLSAQPAGASLWEDYGSRRRGKRAVEAPRAPVLRQ